MEYKASLKTKDKHKACTQIGKQIKDMNDVLKQKKTILLSVFVQYCATVL